MVVALLGESVTGEYASDCGIRRRRRAPGDFAECGAANGEGGGREAEADFIASPLEKEPLVAGDGCVVDCSDFSMGNFGKVTPALTGLVKTGVRAFRNSVYASGGVIGVELLSSRLIESERPVWSSDGNVALLGVLSGGRVGFVGPMAPGS